VTVAASYPLYLSTVATSFPLYVFSLEDFHASLSSLPLFLCLA
jgi:hypothetical protein